MQLKVNIIFIPHVATITRWLLRIRELKRKNTGFKGLVPFQGTSTTTRIVDPVSNSLFLKQGHSGAPNSWKG